jgi:methanogenic corrinoid protein MtbC1
VTGGVNLPYMSTSEVMQQLHAAIAALEEEDIRQLPEAVLTEQINQLVAVLHQLDKHLTRVANAVLARTFSLTEVVAA